MTELWKKPISRRDLLAGAATVGLGAAAAACAPPGTSSNTGGQTGGKKQVRILQWSHFIPAYDTWLDGFVKDWGAKNNVDATIDHISTDDLPARMAAEVAAKGGHDIVEMNAQILTYLYEKQLVDMGDVVDYVVKKYGQVEQVGKSVAYVNGKWLGVPNFYIAISPQVRSDLFTQYGMDRKTAKRRGHELLERHGLGNFAEKTTDALSKGMQQKVQMLASIAHDPEFVILDEPSSGLDPVNQQVMEEIIRDMAKRQRTVLFSTHVMQHAERLCDRIVLIGKGKKIFDGTIGHAKELLPRRIRLETDDDVEPLRQLQQVASVKAIERENDSVKTNGTAGWNLELREQADAQVILQTCFTRGIRLRSFNQSDPSLHEVSVALVGDEAKEVALR